MLYLDLVPCSSGSSVILTYFHPLEKLNFNDSLVRMTLSYVEEAWPVLCQVSSCSPCPAVCIAVWDRRLGSLQEKHQIWFE